MKKFIKYLLYFWMSFFVIISAMGAARYEAIDGANINGDTKNIIHFLSSLLYNIKHYNEINKPILIKNSYLNHDNGFKFYTKKLKIEGYILISVWDVRMEKSIIKLIRIKDQKIIYKWKIDFNKINSEYNKINNLEEKKILSESNTRINHPYLFNNGDIVFGAGGLYKINKFGNYIWRKSGFSQHHSIEKTNENIFWTCSFDYKNSLKYSIRDNALYKINGENGNVIFTKSLLDIFLENNYSIGEILVNTDIREKDKFLDYFHLNDIEPVNFNSQYWKKGDLFLSLRNKNMILLYRPSTNKIIWSKSGPWLKQHDIQILDSNSIGIFGNDILSGKFNIEKQAFINSSNNHYTYNFEQNKTEKKYSKIFKKLKISTYTEGRSFILKNGNIFIEETKNGRLIFANKYYPIWSYIEKVDEDQLSMFSWSRYITEEEFSKFTFLKNK